MFFFENYTVTNVLSALGILVALILINGITRRTKIMSIVFYILIPIVFTFTKKFQESPFFKLMYQLSGGVFTLN